MLQLRPTFSESWYRVATLKPRLRPGAQISRQYFRHDRWYVVRDPAGNQFHRLSDAAYRFVGLLDGQRSVEEAWDLVGGQLADDAPTQPEVIDVLSQLYAANLLETNIPPDAMVLLRRHKQLVEKKIQGRLMNVLFPRVPLWDPDRFLCRWMPVAEKVYSKLGALIWLAVVGLALSMGLPQWSRLSSTAERTLDFQHNIENLFYLYATFVFIKLFHELGHAFACRRFGGECHELGLMLLVMVPTPYVDASTAWAFANKWQRVFVGAAGMIVELFIASLCAFVWCTVDPQSSPLISQLAYNAMFIASVSTLLFNANPLLRYDGYYILSDILEIPNLRQKSTEYTLGLIKRHVFRLRLTQPLPPFKQRAWLLVYSIASSIYRVFIGIFIVVMVIDRIPVLGPLMAIGAVVTWAGVPLYQLVKYLFLDPELHRKRTRAIAFSVAVTAAVALLIGMVRFPLHVEFAGVVRPDDPLDARGNVLSGDVKAAARGQVTGVYVYDGQSVTAGQTILQLSDPEVTHDLKQAEALIHEYEAKITQSRITDEKNGTNDTDKNLADLKVFKQRLADAQRRREELTIKAPFAGRLVSPDIHELQNTYIVEGQLIAKVAVLDKLIIKGDIEQTDFQLLRKVNPQKIEIRLAGAINENLVAGTVELSPAAGMDLVDPSLGTRGGGAIPVDPQDPKGLHAQVPVLEAQVKLDNSAQKYLPGQRAYVRVTLAGRSIAWRVTNRFLQLFQEHEGKWL